jgi:hypothetical protein
VCTLCSWEVAINLKKSLIRTCKNCFSLFKSQERCKINITLRNEVEKRRNVPGKSYDVRQYTGTLPNVTTHNNIMGSRSMSFYVKFILYDIENALR